MKKITNYYTDDEIIDAVLSQDPDFVVVCQLIKDDVTTDADIKKVKNKEL